MNPENLNSFFRPFRLAALALLLSGLCVTRGRAQGDDNSLPHLVTQDGRHALIVDGAPFLILGAQCHNSSGWPAMLPKVWPAIDFLHANTLEIPVYWEQFEPEPGKFDPSVVDTILKQAREHQRAAGVALVRHLEKRQLALPAALDEKPAGQISRASSARTAAAWIRRRRTRPPRWRRTFAPSAR